MSHKMPILWAPTQALIFLAPLFAGTLRPGGVPVIALHPLQLVLSIVAGLSLKKNFFFMWTMFKVCIEFFNNIFSVSCFGFLAKRGR